jgi:peptidoglycan-associated lipoprotein
MKTNLFHSSAILVVVALFTGCASGPAKEDSSAATPGAQSSQATATSSGTRGPSASPRMDPKTALSKRSIYYDYDQYDIKAEFRPVVEAHAQQLRANPAMKIRIEGNGDERGSREYNLALGQKRAEGVKKMLLLLGVSDKQMEAISFGEEKPVASGHDETSWSQNRRSDIAYDK